MSFLTKYLPRTWPILKRCTIRARRNRSRDSCRQAVSRQCSRECSRRCSRLCRPGRHRLTACECRQLHWEHLRQAASCRPTLVRCRKAYRLPACAPCRKACLILVSNRHSPCHSHHGAWACLGCRFQAHHRLECRRVRHRPLEHVCQWHRQVGLRSLRCVRHQGTQCRRRWACRQEAQCQPLWACAPRWACRRPPAGLLLQACSRWACRRRWACRQEAQCQPLRACAPRWACRRPPAGLLLQACSRWACRRRQACRRPRAFRLRLRRCPSQDCRWTTLDPKP